MEKQKKQYVFIIDKNTHERKAAFLVGAHGKTLEAVMRKAEAEYPDDVRVASEGEELFDKLVPGNKLFIDGKVVEKPPYVPSEEELLAAAKNSKLAELRQLLNNTDYKAIKFAEGAMSAQEFEPVRLKRQAWREAYNAIEETQTVAEVEGITWEA